MNHQSNNNSNIATKIDYELLLKHPLFIGVSIEQLKLMLQYCEVRSYSRSEKVLYAKSPRDGIILLLQGMVEVFVEHDETGKEDVIEAIYANDIFGLSCIADFLGETQQGIHLENNVEVRAVEDSVCLKIPFNVLEIRWAEESVRDYLIRKLSVRIRDVYATLAEHIQLAKQWGDSETFTKRVQDFMTNNVVAVDHSEDIQYVAKKMVDAKVSSIVVMENEQLVGLITEKDLVKRIIASGNDYSQPIHKIMTLSPPTVNKHAFYYEALSLFLTENIRHLPVVEDNKVIGLVTLSDLFRRKNRGTIKILQTIEESTEDNLADVKKAIYDVLNSLIADGIPVTHTLETITNLYDRLVKHCIDLAINSLDRQGNGKPPVPFCWFQMGSAGRREQFILTDQDHFLVYKEIDEMQGDPQSEAQNEQAEWYFSLLGEEIVKYLEMAGYKRCRGDMMANNPIWRGSLSRWEERLRSWMLRSTNEKLMIANNFFSYRFVYGDQRLYEDFLQVIKQQTSRSSIFLYRLAELEKLNPVSQLGAPIRSLFGFERKQIDLKKEALFQFHHAIQILSLRHGIIEGTPLQRIKQLVNKQVMTKEFSEDILAAYASVMKVRVEQAWIRYRKNETNLSVIPFNQLRTRDKEELNSALKVMRSLQTHLLTEFGL
ncbi:DUF294 nucleotidyltransferase-like domain-containing protein [Desulfuribacillus alkaliarsenatis]|uniref:Signal transduction protein n=1 Tax=Desulfuribacillus alkaliarsenatis TaxID=766136 RepID=A0A1E5FZ65_9FIRM|nr:DUF294 nucleotidyltransferase-like domain-containing protein [Desulfuribacillus alkaliarsenatis]OEF95863.1 hypothetical protein BHF68_10735 [Desulfuribacillus alkaliarsenatis]